jgi:DNA polymerase I
MQKKNIKQLYLKIAYFNMITIENKGSDIYLFGRKDKEPIVIKDTRFKPYFYAEIKEGEFRTIDNKRAKKVIMKMPSEVRNARDQYTNTYEADIIYTNRYIIDMINEMKQEQLRIIYIDIEVMRTQQGYESVEKVNNIINCIGCYDNFDKIYKQFILSNYKSETKLLTDFIKYIHIINPDIFIAWNGEGFDFPFLVNKIKKLKLQDLARLHQSSYTKKLKNNTFKTHIFGRVCFDLMEAYKKMNSYGGRESWSLDYISKYEGIGGKEKYKGELDDLYITDLQKFITYNKRDVELLVLLNEKLKIIDFFDEVRRLCFCKFEDVFMNSKIADCLCLKYSQNKFVLPTCKEAKKEKFTGAFVHDVEPKLHKNIAIMDMKSLYPSVIIGFNISYETILPSFQEGCINIDNKLFFKKETGIIPAIIKPMLEKRKEFVGKLLKIENRESIEYKSLWTTQYALKVITNSFYGVLGLPYFRLYSYDCAQAVTYIAQRIIKEVHAWFENKGCKVIYGDTDSIHFEIEEKSTEEIINLNKEINLFFKDYFRQFSVNDKDNIFKLEFEKICKTIFFKRKSTGEGAKKKYACRIIWEDGKIVDKFSVTGFESKRSDSPDVGRQFMNDILKMICYDEKEEIIKVFIEQFKEQIRNGTLTPEEIGLPISITKPLNEYANQIYAKAARLANHLYNAQIQQGDKIKYVFLQNNPAKVIAFKSHKSMWDGYEIDYNQMIRRIVDLKIGPLFESLGWNYEYLEFEKQKIPKIIKQKSEIQKIDDGMKQCSLF